MGHIPQMYLGLHQVKEAQLMRILEFEINGQNISKSKNCDFSGIVPGTSGYLKASLSFSSEWSGMVKVAEFRKYVCDDPVSVAIINNECMVPTEVTGGKAWYIKVIGKRRDVIIPTKNCRVRQEG